VFTEWTPESLSCAVGLLIDRGDFYGAQELVDCYGVHEHSDAITGLETKLGEITSGRVDLWRDATYRKPLQAFIDASPFADR